MRDWVLTGPCLDGCVIHVGSWLIFLRAAALLLLLPDGWE